VRLVNQWQRISGLLRRATRQWLITITRVNVNLPRNAPNCMDSGHGTFSEGEQDGNCALCALSTEGVFRYNAHIF
jgi:hypothetical protein